MKDVELDGLLPGIKMSTDKSDFAPIQQLQLMRFKGEAWERFGDVLQRRAARPSQQTRNRSLGL